MSLAGDFQQLLDALPADWTDLNGRGANAYTQSKTLAEKEAWAIVDKAESVFTLAH